MMNFIKLLCIIIYYNNLIKYENGNFVVSIKILVHVSVIKYILPI